MNDMRQHNRSVDLNDTKISARGVQVYYADTHAIKDVDVEIKDKTVTAFIGPSGCGKSTFLRTLNRMNDTIDICRVTGEILLDGEDIYDKRVDPVQLRAKVGWCFKSPIRSRNRSTTTSPMVRAFTASPVARPIWM